ncbi:anti-sigma factor domain-containing protein [Marinomonas sp. IMCC 4694]|uniref:anti-sigma factor n=1 Tax=Marinomonas sp. IMCC 4694 TaxID=2605432 RepID=UPI0011E893FC|nr:anti-sigma factor [Marinomonas sp. IMCC 4694]TYL47452.1 RNA polymerase subunit sigma-70 [Marinomonas sp. IMCC 4694]
MSKPHSNISDTDTDIPDTDSNLAGQYVLGTLDKAARLTFEARLVESPALQKKVNQWQNHFVSITDKLPPVSAPPPLTARIERSLDALDQPATSKPTREKTSFWQSLPIWRGLTGAGMALAVFFAVQLHTLKPTPSEPTYIAVLVAPEDKTPGWVIQTNQSNQRQLQLVPLMTIDIPEGKALQFWTKADNWDAPVSLGLVKKGETLRVELEQLPPLAENQLFELTLEQETGSPTGRPTGPITSIGRGVIML